VRRLAPLAAALLGPILIGVGAGVFLQVTDPRTRVYAAVAPGLLTGIAGIACAAVLSALVLVRGRAATAAKTAAEATAAAVREAEARAASDRLRFLMRLDHELKNPLTAIHAGLANAKHAAASNQAQPDEARANEKRPDEARASEALASVSAQAARITRLLGDLRKLADLETRDIETAPVDLPGLLAEVEEAADAIPEAGDRTIQMSVPRAPWPLPLIDGDRDLIFIALQNLVANAVKFSAPGDTVEIRASEDGSWVLLEVADTGTGIPDDEIAEVWQELARGRAARSVPGTGIGLALVRVVATRHGGQVAIRSREGQGTVVSVRLPVRGSAADTRARAAPPVAEPRPRRDPHGTVPA
jgi:two-component system OmpR family sensor kinase